MKKQLSIFIIVLIAIVNVQLPGKVNSLANATASSNTNTNTNASHNVSNNTITNNNLKSKISGLKLNLKNKKHTIRENTKQINESVLSLLDKEKKKTEYSTETEQRTVLQSKQSRQSQDVPYRTAQTPTKPITRRTSTILQDKKPEDFNYLLNRRISTNNSLYSNLYSNSNNNNNYSQANDQKDKDKDKKPKNNDLDRQSLVDLTVDNQKIIAQTESTNTLLAGWLRIYSPTYKNQKLFPEIALPNYSKKTIKLDEESGFRINDKFAKDDDFFKRFSFYFRISNKNLYYSNDESSLSILDSLPIKRIQLVEDFPLTNPEDSLCIKLKDTEKINDWKLCALDLTTTKTWGCMVKNIIGQIDQSCKERKEILMEPTIITQTITQPILLIPQPSRQCNENWNYFKKGEDWECECKEGKEQSPIDLPKQQEAIPSPVKPIFQYDEVGPKEVVKVDGIEGTDDYKLELTQNMIVINAINTGDPLTGGFGKVITLDGSIYKAERIVFHTPSEHTIDGVQYDLEMQVIHSGVTKGDISKSLVLSVLFTKKPGVYNRFVDSLDFFNLPKVTFPVSDMKNSIYIPKVLFDSESDDLTVMKPVSFYTYQGSLSYPPCNEKTINYVLSKPISLSTTAIQMFKESIRIPDYRDNSGNIIINKEKAENNRMVQPLNGRSVFFYDHVKYCGPDPEKIKKVEKVDGHFEKVSSKVTQYIYVNSDTPSGMPGSLVVDENEAKGLAVK